MTEIRSAVVIGAGTMGLGIAQVIALSGIDVKLYDLKEDILVRARKQIEENFDQGIKRGKLTAEAKKKALSLLTFTTQRDDLTADLIIEAVVEKLEVKVDLFKFLETINSPSAIFASNTSSIPITHIGATLTHPERLVGMHFFNPAHIMKLVEVISGSATSPEAALQIKTFANQLGKVAVMAKDEPGFIVNRVARHFYVESLKVLEENVSTVKGIDRLMEASGFRMGPFRLMDLIGVDTNFSVTTSMYNSFHQDSKFRPSRIQEQKVAAGHHGKKTGKGFYEYETK